jgi:nucleoside-triphosphatase
MWPLYLAHYGSSTCLLRKYLFGKPPSIHNVLLSGEPGCGKTTVIFRLAQGLCDLRLAGFYTEEIRVQGHRVGFEAISFSGRRALLAHVQSPSPHRVGPYGVEPEQLEPLVQEELVRASEVDVYLIDEVGKMEVLCPAFAEVVPRLLSGKVPVIMTVAQRGRGLIAQVKYRDDVRMVTVREDNRDALPDELERWVREWLPSQ